MVVCYPVVTGTGMKAILLLLQVQEIRTSSSCYRYRKRGRLSAGTCTGIGSVLHEVQVLEKRPFSDYYRYMNRFHPPADTGT